MNHRTKLVVYLTFMALVITGTLFLAASAKNSNCPVCDHSLVTEGLIQHSTLSTKK
jgi:hypothetical protein